jgi:beta-lactamase regulating signal transducer with metallopeptidase domain
MFLRFLPSLAARVQHRFWLTVIGFGFLVPTGTLLGLWGDSNAISSDPKSVLPDGLSRSGVIRLLLLVFVAPALCRAVLLVRGGITANRLRRLSIPVDLLPLQEVLPRALVVNVRRYRARIFSGEPTTLGIGPFTSGVRRPFILIPAGLFIPSKRQMLVSVVAHELAHVQRQDMLWHLVSEILLIPLAFHPLSYVLRNRLAETREMACDALVAEQVLPATDYARSLLDVAGTLRDSASPLHALGISESATLERRIRALISLSSWQERNLTTWQKCCLILTTSTLLVLLFSSGRAIFLWISAVPRPSSEILQTAPPPPPPPPPNRR